MSAPDPAVSPPRRRTPRWGASHRANRAGLRLPGRAGSGHPGRPARPALLASTALAAAVAIGIVATLVADPRPRSDVATGPTEAPVHGTDGEPGAGGGAGKESTGKRPPPPPAASCRVSGKLVPSCGVLWGVAPGAFTGVPPAQELRRFEAATGRHSTIFHVYHRGDELFPTPDEITAAREPGKRRIILVNWKVAWGRTWADVAAGRLDGRIDRLARHIRASYRDKFFLAIHHEPENDVVMTPDSGMTAKDYAAMFRHTVRRLRAGGVENVVTVAAYMGYEGWCVQPWFADLWPGDDVTDWIAYDPYLNAKPGGYAHGDFSHLVNLTGDEKRWPGFYNWATRVHPTKPLMVAEWGVFEYPADPSRKAWIFSTVVRQLPRFPAIKALVYFDSPAAPKGDTRPDSSPQALREYRKLASNAVFRVLVG